MGEWRPSLLTELVRHAARDRPTFVARVLDPTDTDRTAALAALPQPARLEYSAAVRTRYNRQDRWHPT